MSEQLAPVAFGSTGMEITRVGFGAWAIGGGGWTFAWGEQDDSESVAAIRHAVESGINWIDTAAVYGLGHSEEVVARALRDLPEADRPFVFTKGGLVWDETDRTKPPRGVGNPASLRRELEASLRRLGVERVDLYQMHWPPEDGTPLEAYWQTFVDLRKEGSRRGPGLTRRLTAARAGLAGAARAQTHPAADDGGWRGPPPTPCRRARPRRGPAIGVSIGFPPIPPCRDGRPG